MECGLVYDGGATLAGAIPAKAVDGLLGAALLEDDADGVGEADGIVGDAAGQQEHVALVDENVTEDGSALSLGLLVNNLKEHGALMLIEPLRRLVDVIIGTGVGPPNDLICVSE